MRQYLKIPMFLNDRIEGIFDTTVSEDYKGNVLGVEAAIALWRCLTEGKPLTPLMDELDDPKFRDNQTPARLLTNR